MAKLQRWRQRGRAGEGDSPVEAEESDGAGTDPGEGEGTPDDHEAGQEPEADGPEARDDAEDFGPEPGELEPEEFEPEIPASRYRDDARGALRDWPPLVLVQACHPKQAIATAIGVFLVAILAGREAREAGVILMTVLVGQGIVGLHNDLVDRRRDAAHETPAKPIADGRLSTVNAWTALILLALLLLPLAITTGITAGLIYLAAVAVGMLGNVLFRTTPLSVWSWAVSFGMLPAYITYGGWGGQAIGTPPETAMTILFALFGVGIHFLRSVWGLVPDHEDGWTYLPLKLGLKLGATRLLVLSTLYLAVVLVAIAITAGQVGISR